MDYTDDPLPADDDTQANERVDDSNDDDATLDADDIKDDEDLGE